MNVSAYGGQYHSNNSGKRNSFPARSLPPKRKSIRIMEVSLFEFLFIFCNSEEIPGLTIAQIKTLYNAKCKDLGLENRGNQELRFIEFCRKSIKDRKIILNEVNFTFYSS